MTDITQPSGLRHYVSVLRRRKWIVIQALVLIPLAVVVISLLRPTMYAATARVMAVDQSSTLNIATGTNVDAQTLDERSLETLASFVATRDVARRAAERLPSPVDIDELLDQVEAETDPNADVILITAENADAGRSGAVANAFAEAFVDWRRETQQLTLDEALETVDQQIDASEAGSYARQLLIERRRQLEVLKVLMNGGVAVDETAETPDSPASPKPIRDGALAFAAALVIAVGLAFVREAFDVRVRSADEIAGMTDLPIIGAIPDFTKTERGDQSLVGLDDPSGPTAEAYRFVRANLDFVNFNHDVKVVLVTSPGPGQGKSTTIANLAITLLRAGKRIALVEGDLRRPALHRFFNIPNANGVTTVVSGAVPLESAVQVLTFGPQGPAITTRSGSQSVHARGEREAPADLRLSLLPSGPIPPNPGEIVTSPQLTAIIDALKESHDYVLVDAPPMFAVGDAAAMADKVDGIIAILRLDETTQELVQSVDEFLKRLPARTLGIVVTGVPRTAKGRYYRYEDYYGPNQ